MDAAQLSYAVLTGSANSVTEVSVPLLGSAFNERRDHVELSTRLLQSSGFTAFLADQVQHSLAWPRHAGDIAVDDALAAQATVRFDD